MPTCNDCGHPDTSHNDAGCFHDDGGRPCFCRTSGESIRFPEEYKPKNMSKFAGHEWVEENIRATGSSMAMSDLGKDVADLLGELFGGIYHLDSKALKRVNWSEQLWIEFTLGHKELSTCDFDELTRLVFLAHHTAIRVSIEASTHKHLKLLFHRRERTGGYSKRHPYLEEAVKRFKDNVSLPEYDKETAEAQ